MAFVGRGRAAHARDGDRDAAASDADARHRDLTNTRARGCPEKVFALVRARDALTRARWGVETTLRENGGALREWRRATAKATTGARRAVAETTATTKHEAARVGAGWERAGVNAPERAAAESEGLARSVVAHLARVAELRDARTWLFAEDDAETSEEAEETEAIRSPVREARVGDGEDSDGILDFTDSDDEEVFAPTPAPATRASRTGERIASVSSASSPSPPPPPPRTKRRWLRIRHSRRSPPTRSPRRRKRSPRRVPRRLLPRAANRQTPRRSPRRSPRVGGGGARVRRGRRPRGGGNVRVRGVTNRALAIGVVSSFGRDGGGTVERVRVRGVGRRDGGDGNRGRAGPAKHER